MHGSIIYSLLPDRPGGPPPVRGWLALRRGLLPRFSLPVPLNPWVFSPSTRFATVDRLTAGGREGRHRTSGRGRANTRIPEVIYGAVNSPQTATTSRFVGDACQSLRRTHNRHPGPGGPERNSLREADSHCFRARTNLQRGSVPDRKSVRGLPRSPLNKVDRDLIIRVCPSPQCVGLSTRLNCSRFPCMMHRMSRRSNPEAGGTENRRHASSPCGLRIFLPSAQRPASFRSRTGGRPRPGSSYREKSLGHCSGARAISETRHRSAVPFESCNTAGETDGSIRRITWHAVNSAQSRRPTLSIDAARSAFGTILSASSPSAGADCRQDVAGASFRVNE